MQCHQSAHGQLAAYAGVFAAYPPRLFAILGVGGELTNALGHAATIAYRRERTRKTS